LGWKKIKQSKRLTAGTPESTNVRDYKYFTYLKRFYESESVAEYFRDFYELLVNITNALVLDAGCGIGYASRRLINSENEVLSLEINLHTLRYGIDNNCVQNPLLGSVYNLPVKTDSADVVLFLDVIEHLDKPVEALGEIRRVLRAKGRLFLITPNGIFSQMLGFEPSDSTHVHECTWSELRSLLERSGFGVSSAVASGLPLVNRLNPKFSRKLAKAIGRLALPIACPSFWVIAERL